MPFNSSGVYSLPAGSKAIAGQQIIDTQHNVPLEDIRDALSTVLVRDGRAPMTGPLILSGDATLALHALPKQQFDARFPIESANIKDGAVSASKLSSTAIFDKIGFLSILEYGGGPAKTAAQNKAAIVAAYAALPAEGGTIYFPNGKYECDGDIALTGKSVCFTGASRNTWLIFPSGQSGVQVTISAGDKFCDARNICFVTRGSNAAGKYGLEVIYTPTGFANRWAVRVQFDDVHFFGIDVTNTAWATPVRLSNCNGFTMRGGSLTGQMGASGTAGNAEADNTTSPIGVIYTGTEYPTDVIFENVKFWSYDTVCKADGAAEGINFFGCTVVNAGLMLDWVPTSGYGGRPQLTISNTHCNSYKGVAKVSAIQQVTVDDGNTFYHNPGATSSWIGLDLDDVIDATIRGKYLTYEAVSGAHTTAIRVTGTQSYGVDIDHCIFGGKYAFAGVAFENGIIVAAGVPSRAVKIGKHNQFNCIYDITLNGTSQTVGDPTFSATLSANQSIPNNAFTDVTWNSLVEDGIGVWSGSAASFTIPQGVHFIDVHVAGLIASNATGIRAVQVLKNGASLPQSYYTINPTLGGSHTPLTTLARRVPVAFNDTIKIQVYQNSGGALDFFAAGYSRLTIEKVG